MANKKKKLQQKQHHNQQQQQNQQKKPDQPESGEDDVGDDKYPNGPSKEQLSRELKTMLPFEQSEGESEDSNDRKTSKRNGKRPAPGFLFCASQLADGSFPFTNGGDKNKDNRKSSPKLNEAPSLPPMKGSDTSFITSEHPQLMPKEVYMAKQHSIFQELSGYNGWKEFKQGEKERDDKDPYLTKITEYVIAGLDESIYNEFLEQRYIMDEVEYAGQEALCIVADDFENHIRLRELLYNYTNLKAQASRLELEFVKMRKARLAAENEVTEVRNDYQTERIKRIKLEELCRYLNRKVVIFETFIGNAAKDRKNLEQQLQQLQREVKELQEQQQQKQTPPPPGPVEEKIKRLKGQDREDFLTESAINHWDMQMQRIMSSLKSAEPEELDKQELYSTLSFFLDHYKAREDYASHQIKMKNLENQVYLARAEKYKQSSERESKKARILGEQFEVSAKSEYDLRKRLMEYEEKLKDAKKLFETSGDTFASVRSSVKENQSLKDEVADLQRQLADERKEKETLEGKVNFLRKQVKANEAELERKGRSNGSSSAAAPVKDHHHDLPEPILKKSPTSNIYKPGMVFRRKGLRGLVVDQSTRRSIDQKGGGVVLAFADEEDRRVMVDISGSDSAHWFDTPVSTPYYRQLHALKAQYKREHPSSESESDEEDYISDGDDDDDDDELQYDELLDMSSGIDNPRVITQFLEGSIHRIADDSDTLCMNGEAKTRDFFQSCFGFDITGMSFPEVLEKFSHNETDCHMSQCPIHSNKAPLRRDWNNLMNEFSKHSPIGATSNNGAESIQKKPVYGPEKPPNMK